MALAWRAASRCNWSGCRGGHLCRTVRATARRRRLCVCGGGGFSRAQDVKTQDVPGTRREAGACARRCPPCAPPPHPSVTRLAAPDGAREPRRPPPRREGASEGARERVRVSEWASEVRSPGCAQEAQQAAEHRRHSGCMQLSEAGGTADATGCRVASTMYRFLAPPSARRCSCTRRCTAARSPGAVESCVCVCVVRMCMCLCARACFLLRAWKRSEYTLMSSQPAFPRCT